MTERRPDAAPQHLDAAEALDYLEGRLAAAREAWVEAHLATACTTCRERLAALAALVGTMRADRSAPAPAAWVARARRLHSPARGTETGAGVIERVARLLFDSWTAPLQPAVRRALGETRRLRFQLDAQRLELEVEPEGDGLASVRGVLAASDAPLWRLTLEAGDAPLPSAPDARGTFAFARAPEPLRRLVLAGPAARYVVDLPAPPA
jgi:hypothetical protein